MDKAGMYAALVGAILPPLIAFFQSPDWGKVKRVVPVAVVSLLAGTGTAYFTPGAFNPADWVGTVLMSLTFAVTTYHLFWKPVTKKIEGPKTPEPSTE